MHLPRIQPGAPHPRSPEERTGQRLSALERAVTRLTTLVSGGAANTIPVVDSLSAPGRKGRVVYLTLDDLVYKDTGAAWISIG